MGTEPSPAERVQSGLRRRVTHGFIAAVLILFALDTLPCTPPFVRRIIQPVLNVTGLWQGTWGLFAPIPDAANHRLQAEFVLHDGTIRTWNSPDWRSQSAWQRFKGHRHSEFLERVWVDDNAVVWPDFTRYLVDEHVSDVDRDQLARVDLYVIESIVPPPPADANDWSAIASSPAQRKLFFTLLYADTEP